METYLRLVSNNTKMLEHDIERLKRLEVSLNQMCKAHDRHVSFLKKQILRLKNEVRRMRKKYEH